MLTRKWCDYKLPDIIRDIDREYAYKRFYRAIKNENVANRQTIKRWFDLSDNKSIPNRNQIFKIAFALKMSVKETEEYLMNGISDAGFQVNDYEEFIMMYCLDNEIDYEQYNKMLDFYEKKCKKDCEYKQTAHTQWLEEQYESVKNKTVEEFMVWVCKNQSYFKGYSLKLLNTYRLLIEQSLQYVRKEAKDSLLRELEPLGFFQWARQQNIAETFDAHDIERFIRNKLRQKDTTITVELAEGLRKSLAEAYASKDRIKDLISEIYVTFNEYIDEKNNKKIPEIMDEIKRVDSKYISELLHIAFLKEEQMKRKIEIANIEDENEKKEERKKLAVYSQRVHQVQRNDLLILIQYIFYKNSISEAEQNGKQYVKETALHEFCEYANKFLKACGMRLMNEAYMFDAMLFACFGESDMYLFAEILEV